MDTDLIIALLIGAAFGAALVVPAVQAYRGSYRSWTYRGLATRYGAFAIGGIGAGVILMFVAAVLGSDQEAFYYVVGGAGFLLIVAGLIAFVWMPRALVPAWRQDRLDNAALYKTGSPSARLTSATVRLDGDRVLAVYRRSAPVHDSEYVALSALGLHVRPRLRLPAILTGTLPDRTTGAATDAMTVIRGDLLVDADAVVFVQGPSADAEFADNWFIVIPDPPQRSEISAAPTGATWTLPTVAGDVTITVPDLSAGAFHDEVRRATRPRRRRQTIHGELTR